MHKILFLRTYEGAQKGHRFDTDLGLALKVDTLTELFASAREVVEKIDIADRFNVYYTVSHVKNSADNKREFERQSAIPIDIDGVPDNQRSDVVLTAIEALHLDYAKTAVIYSGNGVQLIIETNQEFHDKKYFETTRQFYKNMINSIAIELEKKGLAGKVDPAVWSAARLMRMPFTINSKPEKGLQDKQAVLMQGNLEPQEFSLMSYRDNGEGTISIDDVRRMTYVEEKGVLSCPFLQYCFDNQPTITEPEWYAMIGILAFIPSNGEQLCHTYSLGHPKYSQVETDKKIAQTLKLTGPRKCSSVSCLWSGCGSCEHRLEANITTPLLIHTDEYIKSQDTGFYFIEHKSNGEVKRTPDYEGLARYFKKLTNYMTIEDTEAVFGYNEEKGIWERVFASKLHNFAMNSFNPKGTSKLWNEFASWIYASELAAPDFLSGGSSIGKTNLINGVFDIASGELLQHSPEYGFMNMLPFEYDPTATCPNFDKFMMEVTENNIDMTMLLLEFCGYIIGNIPNSRFEKCIILTGEGSNGKSVFLDVIKNIVGKENCSAVRLSDMGDAQQRYSIMNAIVNMPSEEKEVGLKDPAIVKAMISGEAVQVKQLYTQPFSVAINAKHIIACNRVPSANDSSEGIYRRMLIVPFNASFTKEQGNIDVNIRKKLMPELAGIFNRFIEGYKRLDKNDAFTEVALVREQAENYKLSSDPVRMWVEEEVEVLAACESDNPNARVIWSDLFTFYNKWAKERNFFDISYSKFSKDFRRVVKGEEGKRYRRSHSGNRLRYVTGIVVNKQESIKGF